MACVPNPRGRLIAWRLLGLATLSGILAVLLSPADGGHGLVPWSVPPAVRLVSVLPMVAFFVEFARYLKTLDEMPRLIHLQAMLIQFAGTCLAVMTYGVLARVGLVPDLPTSRMWPFVWTAIIWLWAGGLIVVRRRYE